MPSVNAENGNTRLPRQCRSFAIISREIWISILRNMGVRCLRNVGSRWYSSFVMVCCKVCKIDFVSEGHGDRVGYVHFGIRNLSRRAWVPDEISEPTSRKFRWLIWCIAFFLPCAGVEAEFALFSGNHPPVSSRNRIGILAPFQYLIRRLTVRYRWVSKPRDW